MGTLLTATSDPQASNPLAGGFGSGLSAEPPLSVNGSGEGCLDGLLNGLADELDWSAMDLMGLSDLQDPAAGLPLPDVPSVPSVARRLPSVPMSAFAADTSVSPAASPLLAPEQHVDTLFAGDAQPMPSTRSPSAGPGELAPVRHASLLPALDQREKLSPWERRSSEPNPSMLTYTGSPESPLGGISPIGRTDSSLERTSLENSQLSRAKGPLDRATGGIQRRRSLRRGGSVRTQHHETECRIADLSVQLEKALSTNAMLEGRNQLLEQFVGLQAKYTAAGGPPPPTHTEAWWLDAVTRQMVEQRLNLSGMLTFTLRGGRPINLSREQVAALSWLEFCKLWKDYMGALREGLQEVRSFTQAHPGAECPAAKRLARLVYETGILRGCLQTASPNRHGALLCFLPEGEPQPRVPDAAAWRAVAAALGTSQHQRAQLAQLRIMYLRVLGRMSRQRRQLVANLQVQVPVADGGDVGAAAYEATLDAVEGLRGVLRDEHSLLTQYKMIIWGRVFTPVQAAIATVTAYPWAADLPAIVNCIAEELGEPSCEALLAGQA